MALDIEILTKDGLSHLLSKIKNTFRKITVNGTEISASDTDDFLKLNSGDNITITADESTNEITISSTDTVYTHPTFTSKTSGLYKFSVNSEGHISATTAVQKSDITALGIPASDTKVSITNNLLATTSGTALDAVQGKNLNTLISNHSSDTVKHITSDERDKWNGYELLLDEKAKILEENRTVYVSSVGGSDISGDGTSAKPYQSISKALQSVPVVTGNYEYTVNIEGGTYTGFIAKNMSVTFNLQGEVTFQKAESLYVIQIDDANVKILGNGNIINVKGSLSNDALFYIHNGGRFSTYLTTLKLTGYSPSTCKGVYVVSGGMFNHDGNISFGTMDTAVETETNACFFASGIYGTINKALIAKSGSQISFGTSSITATTPRTTESGGRILTGAQT